MPKMTVRVILKSGVEFSIIWTLSRWRRLSASFPTKRRWRTMNKALLSSKNMCWCTPQDFFDKLNAEFGFVLDPAATDKTAKCSLYYTPETDGLSQSWDRGGAVFCNPPYGREIGKWVQKAFEEARGGIRLFYLSQHGQTQHIFTITFTGKRKSASCAGGYGSRTTTGTPPIPRPSLQW